MNYSLRAYGTDPVIWDAPDGDDCAHEWGVTVTPPRHADNGVDGSRLGGGKTTQTVSQRAPTTTATCARCGAMRCELGAEPDVASYLRHVVAVFQAVKRVLRADGVAWCVIASSYGPDKGDLLIPQRLAIALVDAGWIVRQVTAWVKLAPMPECLHPVTKVFVKDEWGVRQVSLDDLTNETHGLPLILTPTGWRRILKVWETVKDEAVTFDAAKVSTVTCSSEHLWPVSHDRRRVVIHEKTAAMLRDTGYTDYLLHHAIEPWLDDRPITMDGQQFDYELGWLLGIYAAEGGFNGVRGHGCKLTLHRDERPIIDRISAIVARRYGQVVKERGAGNYMSVFFHDARWHSLAKLVVPGKCATKALDLDIILNAPREFRQGIWDGYIEGDGGDRAAGVSATSASKALRDCLCVLASSIGIITSKGTNRPTDPRTGKTYVSFALWTPYLTHRKHKKESTARQITIRNKRTVPGPHRMIDLEVEGGLFLIEDGLVTHNSVKDRFTSAWEHVLMLVKSPTYYFDQTAVMEPLTPATVERERTGYAHAFASQFKGSPTDLRYPDGKVKEAGFSNAAGRNRRNVLILPPDPLGESHYAAFPRQLVRILVACSTSEAGVCPACAAPWRRVVERTTNWQERKSAGAQSGNRERAKVDGKVVHAPGVTNTLQTLSSVTTGWVASCICQAGPSRAAVVLDPFSGSCRTLAVARELGQRGVGVELSEEYCQLAIKLLGGQVSLWNRQGESEAAG